MSYNKVNGFLLMDAMKCPVEFSIETIILRRWVHARGMFGVGMHHHYRTIVDYTIVMYKHFNHHFNIETLHLLVIVSSDIYIMRHVVNLEI